MLLFLIILPKLLILLPQVLLPLQVQQNLQQNQLNFFQDRRTPNVILTLIQIPRNNVPKTPQTRIHLKTPQPVHKTTRIRTRHQLKLNLPIQHKIIHRTHPILRIKLHRMCQFLMWIIYRKC